MRGGLLMPPPPHPPTHPLFRKSPIKIYVVNFNSYMSKSYHNQIWSEDNIRISNIADILAGWKRELDAQCIAHGLLVAESRAESLWMDCWCRDGRAVLWQLCSRQPTTGHFLYCIICRKLKIEQEKAVTSALVDDAERKKAVKLNQSTKPPI